MKLTPFASPVPMKPLIKHDLIQFLISQFISNTYFDKYS